MASTLVFGGTAVLLLAMTFGLLFHLRRVRRPAPFDFSPAPSDRSNEPVMRCSIVLAARDEETRVENTVRRLLARSGVQVEIIVVDDRSTDHTGEILRRRWRGTFYPLLREDAGPLAARARSDVVGDDL